MASLSSSYTAEEWLRNWLEGKKAAKSTATYQKYRHTIDSFIATLGPKAKRNLSQMTPATFNDSGTLS